MERNISVPLSEYVNMQLVIKCGLEFLTVTRRVLKDNMSFQRWIFEFNVLTMFHLAIGKRFKLNFRGAPLLASVTLRFRTVVIYSDNQKIDFDSPIVMFVPLKWNQGCFDAVYYWKEGDIPCFAFILCTNATTHDFKLQFVALFLNKLFPFKYQITTRSEAVTESLVRLDFWAVVHDDVFHIYRHGEVHDIANVLLFDSTFGEFREDNPRTRVGMLESLDLPILMHASSRKRPSCVL